MEIWVRSPLAPHRLWSQIASNQQSQPITDTSIARAPALGAANGGFGKGGFRNSWLAALSLQGNLLLQGMPYSNLTFGFLLLEDDCAIARTPSEQPPFEFPTTAERAVSWCPIAIRSRSQISGSAIAILYWPVFTRPFFLFAPFSGHPSSSPCLGTFCAVFSPRKMPCSVEEGAQRRPWRGAVSG